MTSTLPRSLERCPALDKLARQVSNCKAFTHIPPHSFDSLIVQDKHERIEEQLDALVKRKAGAVAARNKLVGRRNALLDRISTAKHSLVTVEMQISLQAPVCGRANDDHAASNLPDHHTHTPVDTPAAAPPQDTSLTRPHRKTQDLYTFPEHLPPPISSFVHCARISYDDLVEASASQAGVRDFAETGFLTVATAAQATISQQLRCSPKDICWFIHSHLEVAPGVPLSFSTSLSSPECAASLALHWLLTEAETAVLGLVGRRTHLQTLRGSLTTPHPPNDALPDPKRSRLSMAVHAGHGGATPAHMHVEHAWARERPSPCGEQGGSVGQGTSCVDSEVTRVGEGGRHEARAGAVEGGGTSSEATVATEDPQVIRCGVNGVCGARAAVRTALRPVLAAASLCSDDGADAAWGIVHSAGEKAGSVIALFERAAAANAAGSAGDGGGSSSEGGAARGAHGATPPGGLACAGADAEGGRGVSQDAWNSGHAAVPDRGNPGVREDGARGGRSMGSMRAAQTGPHACAGAGRMTAAEFQGRTTRSLVAVLRELRDACSEAVDAWQRSLEEVRRRSRHAWTGWAVRGRACRPCCELLCSCMPVVRVCGGRVACGCRW